MAQSDRMRDLRPLLDDLARRFPGRLTWRVEPAPDASGSVAHITPAESGAAPLTIRVLPGQAVIVEAGEAAVFRFPVPPGPGAAGRCAAAAITQCDTIASAGMEERRVVWRGQTVQSVAVVNARGAALPSQAPMLGSPLAPSGGEVRDRSWRPY
jgi:hypothetical protein